MSQTSTLIAIAVVEHNDQFLIGPRPDEAVLSGYWEFPGGKVKVAEGETPKQAAQRECLEETGLHVKVRSRHSTRLQQYDYGAVELHFFLCAPVDDEAVPCEPFRWVRRAELTDYRFPEGNKSLLASLVEQG